MVMTADYPGLYVPTPDAARKLINSHTWLTRDDDTGELRWVSVLEMTPSHRAHLLTWLRTNADTMRGHVLRSIDRAARNGEITWADRAVELSELFAVTAAVWIEDTPLVRQLVQLAGPREPRRERQRWLPARLRGRR